jgi:hypothetical protein
VFFLKRAATLVGLLILSGSVAFAQDAKTDTRPGIAPDIREDEINLKVQRGDFVAVPIPISNPTLDTGLVAGAAYFYPQDEKQKKLQPASLTAAAGMYTSNDSKALVLLQQNYWNHDKWRFTGAIGVADLRLSLVAPDEATGTQAVDWQIKGSFMFAKIVTRIKGDWYGGIMTRLVDAEQSIDTAAPPPDFGIESDLRSVGLGINLEYDSRDMPLNSKSGRYFTVAALFNDEAIGSDSTYTSYSTAYRSYHTLTDSLVLAWEIRGCGRDGTAPLWDACRIKLRGFAATDYLGKNSASSQVEARWQASKRWGLVAFGGAGSVGNSYNGIRDNEAIPSYGVGVRFMVLAAKRINIRIDYARSTDSDAIYLSVGEAF